MILFLAPDAQFPPRFVADRGVGVPQSLPQPQTVPLALVDVVKMHCGRSGETTTHRLFQAGASIRNLAASHCGSVRVRAHL